MAERKVCPLMSDPRRVVLCQGKNCAAACPVPATGGTLWYCGLVEGRPAVAGEGP
jgi:hypothetical protein